MRSSSAAERDSQTDNIEVNTPPTRVSDDNTPTGASDDARLPVTGDTVDMARLAITTDETDAGTLACISSPGRLATERSERRSAVLTVCVIAGWLSLWLRTHWP